MKALRPAALPLLLLLGAPAATAAAPTPVDAPAGAPETAPAQAQLPPDFLDTPDPALRDAYDFNADSDDPRDWRLYGELLLMEGKDEGFSYVDRAARKGDGRAAYLVAQALAYGLWGQEQDYTLAMKWLHTAMSADYAPAYEQMAAISWDGDWNCTRNTHDAIWYLETAISLYSAAQPPDAIQAEKLQSYTDSLQELLVALNKVKDYNWDALGRQVPELKGLMPSFLQLRLSTIPDTSGDGLRRRLTYIQGAMEQRPGKFKIGKLAHVRLEFVGVHASGEGQPDSIACAVWQADDATFSAGLEVHLPALPPQPDAWDDEASAMVKHVYRLVAVNDALAHELAHIYFCSRYPKLAEFSRGDARMTYEGHATNAAYEFTNATFFHGGLSPERYADLFLSEEYREYFFWFRENCLSPAGLVYWEILDRWERNSGTGGYRPHTRRQDCRGIPLAPPLRHFGKAFQGYM